MNRKVNHDGAEIRRLREERLGLSVQQFAARIGIKPQSLSNIELGNRSAGLATLIRISRALGVPVEELLLEEPEPARAAAL